MSSPRLSEQMEVETDQSEQLAQLETAEEQAQMEEQPAKQEMKEEQVKKQEFKDWSLSADVLIKELSEDEIAKLFTKPGKAAEKSDDEAVMIERFVDAAIAESQKARTENNAATFNTSDDPRIDFFFQVLESTSASDTEQLLKSSWNFNCLDTLRLIAFLRDIRSGKSIRYQYYVCLYWIYQHHPLTLLQNLPILIECGYWKDLLQLLMVILFRGKVAKYLFNEGRGNNSSKKKEKISEIKKKKLKRAEINKIKLKFYDQTVSPTNNFILDHYRADVDEHYRPLIKKKRISRRSKEFVSTIASRQANHVDKKFLRQLIARYARERFNQDSKYRYFHLKIAEIMAKQLIDDLANLKKKDFKKISLAAKWAPSLQGHFDKYTMIASSVALQIAKLTRGEDDSVEEIFIKSQQSIPIAAMLARKNYQKGYIVKLREKLQIPERYMCTNQWDVLPYQMVASKCMQKNRSLFLKHDEERFTEFVKSREKVAGATLSPPELIKRALELNAKVANKPDVELELLEKQWNSMRDSINVKDEVSCFKSALSVCDVSGSMEGTPLLAAIGLTMLTMSFTNAPWSDVCLTFSRDPKFVHFGSDKTLSEKVERLRSADWGMNTDLTKTFKLILELATKNGLKQSEMPKYLFIFSDMEFDQACEEDETNYEEAKRLFAEKGYQLPTIIFWNLRSSTSTPVQKNEQGTVLLSGYSAKQLSMLLTMNIEEITPQLFINSILEMEKYKNLVVVD